MAWEKKDIEKFTENVINTQQRLLANNYVKLSKERNSSAI